MSGAPTAHGIELSWAESTQGTTFNIYRAEASGHEAAPAIATGVATTSFLDSSGVAGTTYFYTVTAVLNGVESAFSNEASAVFPIVPAAPSNLTAVAV